jgi:hypothetical protein
VSGPSGKSDAVVGDAMRRRVKALASEGNETGDIAHLEARRQYFAFCSPSQELFSLLIRYSGFSSATTSNTGIRIRAELPRSLPQSILP